MEAINAILPQTANTYSHQFREFVCIAAVRSKHQLENLYIREVRFVTFPQQKSINYRINYDCDDDETANAFTSLRKQSKEDKMNVIYVSIINTMTIPLITKNKKPTKPKGLKKFWQWIKARFIIVIC